MTNGQIERLKKDSRQLGHYIHKLTKKGKTHAARKFQLKQGFLDAAIDQAINRG